jgi:hypothetical protein
VLFRSPVDADEFLFYDAAGHNNKVTGANLKTYIGGAAEVSPIVIPVMTQSPSAIGQGTWALAASSDVVYGGVFYNTTAAANGDNATWSFRCPAGTYSLYIHIDKNFNRGKFDTYIDGGASEGLKDCYYASILEYIVIFTGKVLTAGPHTIRFQLNGKNDASSAYILGLRLLVLERTA